MNTFSYRKGPGWICVLIEQFSLINSRMLCLHLVTSLCKISIDVKLKFSLVALANFVHYFTCFAPNQVAVGYLANIFDIHLTNLYYRLC